MATRDIYLRIEEIPDYSPVEPDPVARPPQEYQRDSMRNLGHEDGRIPSCPGISVDLNGNVYVTDGEKCNVLKFDWNGKFLTKWSHPRTGPGKFLEPESIAVDYSGNVFVADYGNQNIQKFDSNGRFFSLFLIGEGLYILTFNLCSRMHILTI